MIKKCVAGEVNRITIRAVESDFKKSNQSRMPIIQFSDFIRFFNR